MRTTLNLDEDVLQAAKDLAAARSSTLGQVISELARKGLQRDRKGSRTRNGVPLLPSRKDAGVVTVESVHRLLDED